MPGKKSQREIAYCRKCGEILRSRLTGQENKTGLCASCVKQRKTATPNHCLDCGRGIQRTAKRCQKCYTASMVMRNKMRSAALAEARAAKTGWRNGRISKAEQNAQELLDLLDIPWISQVPMRAFVMDIVCHEFNLVIDVRNRYHHNLPGAPERGERRKAEAQDRGYDFLIFWEDERHLWWKALWDTPQCRRSFPGQK